MWSIILFIRLQPVRELDQSFEYLSDHHIPSSSSVSSSYVNLVNCLNTSHLISTSHSIHLQDVREFGQLFKASHLIILFICLQGVRELGQLFEYFSSEHPVPSSSSVSSVYVNLVNCLKTSRLIISPFHSFHLSPACTWIWSIVCRLLSDHLLPSFSSVSSLYVNLVNCFKTSSDYSLNLSPGSTRTWSIVLRPLIWPISLSVSRKYVNLVNCFKTSHLIILFFRLQNVSELSQSFKDLSSDHPFHLYPESTWFWSMVLRPLVWSSSSPIPSVYMNLVNCFLRPLNRSPRPFLFIHLRVVR